MASFWQGKPGSAAADERDDLDALTTREPAIGEPPARHHLAIDLDGHGAGREAERLEQIMERGSGRSRSALAVHRHGNARHVGPDLFKRHPTAPSRRRGAWRCRGE